MGQDKTREHSLFKERTMSQPSLFPAVNPRSPLPILPLLFTILACVSLAVGSLILSLVWLGDGSLNLFGIITAPGASLEGKFLSTIFLSIPTLLVAGLLSTIALLLARRWVAAALAVPMTIGVFIGLYLFLVFVMPSAPAVIFVVLLLLLNGGALWLARWFLTRTFR
jgi:hypothetical protein